MLIENNKILPTIELTFLITCCKTDPSKDDIEFIPSYLQNQDVDFNIIIDLANQHGILPLVYKTLKKLSEKNSEFNTNHCTLLSDLKSIYTQIAQRNMLMSAELIHIMKLLEENDIEALSLKGPILSQIAYGDITLRQYSDLDILVDEKKITKAGSVLQMYGYTPAFPIKILSNKTCLEVTNDLAFYNETNGILIELHWKLFRERLGKHLHFLEINEHKQSIKINGKAVTTLSTEMLLVYLCLHGSKHAWERIEWICDIHRLIYSNKEINWDDIQSIAKKMDTNIPLYLGLRLTHTLFDTPLPENIIMLTKSERIEKLIGKTYSMLNSTISGQKRYSHYNAIHMYQMDLLDTKLKKLKHLYKTYLGISKNDCESFQLPSYLKFLYIFIKPFRVISKYIQYGK